MDPRTVPLIAGALCAGFAALTGVTARAQATQAPASTSEPTSPSEAKALGADAFAALAWLKGCWRGSVNQREFTEHWLPPRANLMLGASHTVFQGRTQSYEFLRIEVRPDGVHYVAAPPGQKEAAYRLVERTVDNAAGRNDEVFTFENTERAFPQRIIYRRGSEGWLYATVEGDVAGAPKQVVYPMRRYGCDTGELLAR
jgi:hypothetical protein